MKEKQINKIMDDITDDSSLCIIREALENYNKPIIISLSKTSILEILKGKIVKAGNDTKIKGYCLDSKFKYYGRE